MTDPDHPAPLARLPAIARHPEGPGFAAPWEAQAFALVVDLHARGAFTWEEWTRALSREIASACEHGGAGHAAPGERYYEHWLAALERLVTAKGFGTAAELVARKAAWKAAADAAPHGEPIVLDAAARGET